MPKLLIRTEGNNKIGLGHIYRSIAVAKEFRKKGYKIHFIISKDSPKEIAVKLKPCGICHQINNQKEESQVLDAINPDIIILDILKKFFLKRKQFFKELKEKSKFVVMIDFIGKESKYANLAIHTLFEPKVKNTNKIIHNLQYCVTRKEFLNYRKKFKIKKEVSSLLILQGGADTWCISPKIIASLQNIKSVNITLIVGASFKCWKELQKTINENPNKIKILCDVKNIAAVMAKHDIAITAAGNSLIELCTIGIPSIVICGERHELEIAAKIHKKGTAINIGYGKTISKKSITTAVLNLIEKHDKRQLIHKNAKKNFDGKGLERMIRLIESEYMKIQLFN